MINPTILFIIYGLIKHFSRYKRPKQQTITNNISLQYYEEFIFEKSVPIFTADHFKYLFKKSSHWKKRTFFYV